MPQLQIMFYLQLKNHTSICDKIENAWTCPLVIVNIEGIKCRALVDTETRAFINQKHINNQSEQKLSELKHL